MGSGSRNLDQPKGDETHLMMKTTAAWYFLCMFFTKNLTMVIHMLNCVFGYFQHACSRSWLNKNCLPK